MSKRIVVKLGTQVVIEDDGTRPAMDRLTAIVADMASLIQQGDELLLVSSGAVGLGRRALSLDGSLTLPEKQACASVGQGYLMNAYRDLFSAYKLQIAQVLVTADDFSTRERYLNLRNTLEKLLELKVVPIINENDTVSVAGLRENRVGKPKIAFESTT